MSAGACPLSGAQIALCRLVHRGPRPQVTLKPLQTELELYVEKTRAKQKQSADRIGSLKATLNSNTLFDDQIV
ncbi:G-protein-signaling modulator 1b isoform X1 [Tachysurus ichikawai]